VFPVTPRPQHVRLATSMRLSFTLSLIYTTNVITLPTVEDQMALTHPEGPTVRCNVVGHWHAERCTIACMGCQARYGEVSQALTCRDWQIVTEL
jgi:hypothetical protein